MDFNNNGNEGNGNTGQRDTGSYNGYGYPNNNGNPQGGNPMGNSPYGYHYSPPYIVPGKSLANAALVLGILSIMSTILMTIFIPLVFGSIAIVLAILSRGKRKNMTGQATAGLICGAGGLVVNFGMLITSLVFIFSHPEILQEAARTYDAQIEQIYGEPTEDILGQSLEDMINETFGLD